MTKYITQTQVYDETQLDVDSFCNDILFYNSTANTVFIDGFPVAAGATYQISGNEGEVNTTKYKLSFGTGNTGFVYVTRKRYI